MLLAVDVGNTQTVLGLYDGKNLREHRRIATEAERTGDELGVLLSGLLDAENVDGICLASTVPALVLGYEDVASTIGIPVLTPGPTTSNGT
jgi:type III pantothenate kinase